MMRCSPPKILFAGTMNDTLQSRNSVSAKFISNYMKYLYFTTTRNVTIQNRSHEPICDFTNKNKKNNTQSVTNKLVAANYLQKLIIGDRTLVNVLESIGDVKLLLQLLIDSPSPIPQKTNAITATSTNMTKRAVCMRNQSLYCGAVGNTGEATYKEIRTIKRNTGIRSKNMVKSVSKRCTTVRLQNYLNTPYKSRNETKILLLNDNNFRSATLKYRLVLVMFYAPWCKYCNDMKPMIRRVAKELPKDVGCIAFCNAEDSTKVANEHNVYVYPSLKLFRGGKYLKDYEGPRRSLELIKFMVNHSKQDDPK